MNLDNKNLINMIRLTGLSIIFSIIYFNLPIFFFLPFVIGGLFMIMGTICEKIQYAFYFFIIYTLMSIVIFNNSQSYILIFVFALPCLIMGILTSYLKDENASYLMATIVCALAMIYIFQNFQKLEFLNSIELMQKELQTMPNTSTFINSLNEMKEAFLSQDTMNVIPSIIFTFSLIYILISKYTGIFILKNKIKSPYGMLFSPFKNFFLPDKLGSYFFIAYIIIYAIKILDIGNAKYFSILSDNIVYIFFFMLSIHGFAVFVFSIKKYSRFLRIILTMIVLVLYFRMIMIFGILAIIDRMIDIRKLGFRRSK